MPALLETYVMHMARQASFGLADELRRRCSGAASAALMLSHWERLQARAAPSQITSMSCLHSLGKQTSSCRPLKQCGMCH